MAVTEAFSRSVDLLLTTFHSRHSPIPIVLPQLRVRSYIQASALFANVSWSVDDTLMPHNSQRIIQENKRKNPIAASFIMHLLRPHPMDTAKSVLTTIIGGEFAVENQAVAQHDPGGVNFDLVVSFFFEVKSIARPFLCLESNCNINL